MKLYKNFFKRIFDLLLLMSTVIIWMPMFIIIYFVLLVFQGTPIFYVGKRNGKNFKEFNIIKFRTMHVKSGLESTGDTVIDSDIRVTKIGSILRKIKADEIPQLFLVLSGKMSIVGPRPELPIYVDKEYYLKSGIADLTPGITDFSSIYFYKLTRYIPKENVNKYVEKFIIPKKNRLRKLYATKISFKTDLYLIYKTIIRILK